MRSVIWNYLSTLRSETSGLMRQVCRWRRPSSKIYNCLFCMKANERETRVQLQCNNFPVVKYTSTSSEYDFYGNVEVIRQIYFLLMSICVKRIWSWIQRKVCLRQRRKTDTASHLKTVSKRSWLRQLLSTFWDRVKNRLRLLFTFSWFELIIRQIELNATSKFWDNVFICDSTNHR